MRRAGSPSSICLLSALSFYGLTDIIPKEIWVLAPLNKRTKFKDLKLFRSRTPQWKIEIIQEGDFRITSLERTIIESLLHRELKFPVAAQALRQALQKKQTSLNKIYEVARKMKLKDRISKKLEVLL